MHGENPENWRHSHDFLAAIQERNERKALLDERLIDRLRF